MISKADFSALVEQAMQTGNRSHMRPVIEKELLHYDILFALDSEGLLDMLTFQGGTSLRLCYGAQRFSEDLDFVGGRTLDREQLLDIKSCVERYLGERYGLEVGVKEPKEVTGESEHRRVKVHKWQIRIVTAPARPDLPKQMIKIEVVNIPAYTRTPQVLRQNYDFLPDGYGDLVILTESLDEIMADKLVSLVDCTAYLRHRDIWDLHWLKQQGATVDGNLVRNKLDDYEVTNYKGNAEQLIERLPDITRSKAFTDQMARFIPLDVQERTLMKDKFLAVLANETTDMLRQAVRSTSGAALPGP